MKWTLLSLCLIGVAFCAARTFIAPYSPVTTPSAGPAASPAPNKPETKGGAQLAPVARPKEISEAEDTTNFISKDNAQKALPNVLAEVSEMPSGHPDQSQTFWGESLRGAPVHSGPSVSSPILGYVAAGTQMKLLERELEWVKVLDPQTLREGWIYEKHVSSKASPEGVQPELGQTQESALLNETDAGAGDQPLPSLKTKRPKKNSASNKRKHYSEKRRRKLPRFVFFRHFF